MLGLDDSRWSNLTGGCRTAFASRPLLARLETEHGTAVVSHELWEELYHQGDAGEASYASVPPLVRVHRKNGIIDWNRYAIAAIIELARNKGTIPKCRSGWKKIILLAIREPAEIGAGET
jgi:hypothetical protein